MADGSSVTISTNSDDENDNLLFSDEPEEIRISARAEEECVYDVLDALALVTFHYDWEVFS